MTRARNTHTVDRVRVTDDGDHRPAGRRYYTSEPKALAGLRRWTAQTEADHRDPDRSIPYRFTRQQQHPPDFGEDSGHVAM